MDRARKPDGPVDTPAAFARTLARDPAATPVERATARVTPWTGEMELPLPIAYEKPLERVVEPETVREPPARPHRGERAPAANLHRHLRRAGLRIGALVIVDAAACASVLGLLQLVGLGWVGLATPSGVGYLLVPEGARSFAVALAIGLAATGNYGAGDRRRDGVRVFVGCILAVCIFAWRQIWASPFVAGGELAALVLALGSALMAARHVLDRVVHRHRARTSIAARTLLVGPAGDCRRAIVRGLVGCDNGFQVLGFVDTKADAPPHDALGVLDDLEWLLQVHDADTVVLCGELAAPIVERVVRASTVEECELLAAAPSFDVVGVHPEVLWRRGRPLLALRAEAERGRALVLKRAFDVTAALALLVVLSPLLALLAIVVRLESPGPAIFGQLRAGRHQRFFRCLKFRSMYRDAEQRLYADKVLLRRYIENDFKLPAGEDPRITRVGRFLRRTSLDELPQLFNIVRGDMSLVGPRPIVRDELKQYADDEPLLLSLRPGLTGLWQVNGRGTVPYPARKYVELEYVQTWTLMRDIEILLRTVPAVLRQRGAC